MGSRTFSALPPHPAVLCFLGKPQPIQLWPATRTAAGLPSHCSSAAGAVSCPQGLPGSCARWDCHSCDPAWAGRGCPSPRGCAADGTVVFPMSSCRGFACSALGRVSGAGSGARAGVRLPGKAQHAELGSAGSRARCSGTAQPGGAVLVFVVMSDVRQRHPWRCPTPEPPWEISAGPCQSPRPSCKKKSRIHRSLLCLSPAQPSVSSGERVTFPSTGGRGVRAPAQAAASPSGAISPRPGRCDRAVPALAFRGGCDSCWQLFGSSQTNPIPLRPAPAAAGCAGGASRCCQVFLLGSPQSSPRDLRRGPPGCFPRGFAFLSG